MARLDDTNISPFPHAALPAMPYMQAASNSSKQYYSMHTKLLPERSCKIEHLQILQECILPMSSRDDDRSKQQTNNVQHACRFILLLLRIVRTLAQCQNDPGRPDLPYYHSEFFTCVILASKQCSMSDMHANKTNTRERSTTWWALQACFVA